MSFNRFDEPFCLMRQWTSNLTRDTDFILFDDLDGMKIIVLNTYIMIFIFLSVLF